MSTSTSGTDFETSEQVPRSSLQGVWVGFVFAFMFFVVEVVFVIVTFDWEGEVRSADPRLTQGLGSIRLLGVIYWLFCVHRIHKILAEMTHGLYRISPHGAALKHLIPLYNVYWIFKWPVEFSDYLNRRGRVKIISGAGLGVMLLLAMIVLRMIDGAIGLTWLFAVTIYMSSKLKAHVKALKGITPDQLPPLPDPAIFSRPIETSGLAQETTERPQAG